MSYVPALTVIHTLISLVALALGVPVLQRLLGHAVSPRWTDWFLGLAVATSVTGFMFPFTGVTPAFVTGIVASVVLALVLLARHVFGLAGPWRWIYATGMVVSVYLLAFVTVVQAFLKVPFLFDLAPTQTELPFLIAQIATLALFVALGVLAASRFKGVAGDMPGVRIA